MDIKDLSIEDLRAEIDRREKEKKAAAVPKMLSDHEILKAILKYKLFMSDNMQSIKENGYPLKDFEHYCFENMLEIFYGPQVWAWYNENCVE